jgi:hypothetical protein
MTHIIEEIVRKHTLPAENYIWGFADLTGLLQNKFEGYNYGISIGRKLNSKIVDKIIKGPTREYNSHYRQLNKDLDLLTKNISDDLNQYNIETLNIDATVSITELDSVYYNTRRTYRIWTHKTWNGRPYLWNMRRFLPNWPKRNRIIKYKKSFLSLT